MNVMKDYLILEAADIIEDLIDYMYDIREVVRNIDDPSILENLSDIHECLIQENNRLYTSLIGINKTFYRNQVIRVITKIKKIMLKYYQCQIKLVNRLEKNQNFIVTIGMVFPNVANEIQIKNNQIIDILSSYPTFLEKCHILNANLEWCGF